MRRLALVALVALADVACRPAEREAPASDRAEPSAAAAATVDTANIPPRVERPRPAELTRVTLKALGMHCEESCPLRVRYALADVAAVYELGFDVSTESIFVSYDATLGPPEEVTRPMLAAIRSAGYDPWLSKTSWPEGATAEVVQPGAPLAGPPGPP